MGSDPVDIETSGQPPSVTARSPSGFAAAGPPSLLTTDFPFRSCGEVIERSFM
jgi:hypothetical protein